MSTLSLSLSCKLSRCLSSRLRTINIVCLVLRMPTKARCSRLSNTAVCSCSALVPNQPCNHAERCGHHRPQQSLSAGGAVPLREAEFPLPVTNPKPRVGVSLLSIKPLQRTTVDDSRIRRRRVSRGLQTCGSFCDGLDKPSSCVPLPVDFVAKQAARFACLLAGGVLARPSMMQVSMRGSFLLKDISTRLFSLFFALATVPFGPALPCYCLLFLL